MTSFWFEVFVLIILALIAAEISLFKHTYARVESAKMQQREKELKDKK